MALKNHKKTITRIFILLVVMTLICMGVFACTNYLEQQSKAFVDMSKVQYVMYYHETLSVVSNFEVARIIDSERFAGSLAQVEMNTGYRVPTSKLARVRKEAGAA